MSNNDIAALLTIVLAIGGCVLFLADMIDALRTGEVPFKFSSLRRDVHPARFAIWVLYNGGCILALVALGVYAGWRLVLSLSP